MRDHRCPVRLIAFVCTSKDPFKSSEVQEAWISIPLCLPWKALNSFTTEAKVEIRTTVANLHGSRETGTDLEMDLS
jgi:hypothetical protein